MNEGKAQPAGDVELKVIRKKPVETKEQKEGPDGHRSPANPRKE